MANQAYGSRRLDYLEEIVPMSYGPDGAPAMYGQRAWKMDSKEVFIECARAIIEELHATHGGELVNS